MKNAKHQVTLVAHVTIRGLEALTRGHIDLSDPRLDGEPGTVQLELETNGHTANRMDYEIKAARALFGNEGGLQHLDQDYILPGLVKIAQVTTGDIENDKYIHDTARSQGAYLKVATSQY